MTSKIFTRLAVAGLAAVLVVALIVTGTPAQNDAPSVSVSNPQYLEGTSANAAVTDTFGAASTDYANAGVNAYGSEVGTTNPRDYYMNENAIKAATFDNIPTIDNGNVSKDFIIEIQRHGYAPFVTMLQDKSTLEQRIGDTCLDFVHGTETYEWFTNDVYAKIYPLAAEEEWLGHEIETRQDAIDMIKLWLNTRIGVHTDDGSVKGDKEYNATLPKSVMDSYTTMQHYVAENGWNLIGHEIGVGVGSFGMRIAFTRGAAKQFKRDMGNGEVDSWWIDYSLWGSDTGMVNYSDINQNMYNAAPYSNPLSGQSISACRRGYYMVYMSGAKWLINEAGGQASFTDVVDENGVYELSAHGEMNQEFYDFVQRNNNRGTTYVPFALILDYEHGMPFADWKEPMPFETFAMEPYDNMNIEVMKTLWPNGYPDAVELEVGQQTATPYGETFDVLLQNANDNILDAYKALIFTGGIDFAEGEQARYVDYVNNGGTLVLNVAYLADFEGTAIGSLTVGEHEVGEGRVIVYGTEDYSVVDLPAILQQLENEYVPVKVSSDDVQYIVNFTDDSVIVSVFNNNGIINEKGKVEEMDPDAIMDVTIEYTGVGEVSQVNDWISGEIIEETSAKQTLTIGPGDLAIIEFVL